MFLIYVITCIHEPLGFKKKRLSHFNQNGSNQSSVINIRTELNNNSCRFFSDTKTLQKLFVEFNSLCGFCALVFLTNNKLPSLQTLAVLVHARRNKYYHKWLVKA